MKNKSFNVLTSKPPPDYELMIVGGSKVKAVLKKPYVNLGCYETVEQAARDLAKVGQEFGVCVPVEAILKNKAKARLPELKESTPSKGRKKQTSGLGAAKGEVKRNDDDLVAFLDALSRKLRRRVLPAIRGADLSLNLLQHCDLQEIGLRSSDAKIIRAALNKKYGPNSSNS